MLERPTAVPAVLPSVGVPYAALPGGRRPRGVGGEIMTRTIGGAHALVTQLRLKHGAFAVLTLAAVGGALYAMATAKLGGMPSREVLTVIAILVAGFIGSVAGFAFSAIAGALLVHLYSEPVEMVRVLFVCSITIQTYCTARIVKSIDWRTLAPYLAGGIVAAPLGTLMLLQLPSSAYAFGLGVFLVAYGVYSLLKPGAVSVRSSPMRDAVVGALGGITGGAAAFPSAFPAIWCSIRQLSKEAQRSICQPYILIVQIWSLAWLEAVRESHSVSLSELWFYVPVSLLAAASGFAVFRRLNGNQFRLVVLYVLIASGVVLVLKAG